MVKETTMWTIDVLYCYIVISCCIILAHECSRIWPSQVFEVRRYHIYISVYNIAIYQWDGLQYAVSSGWWFQTWILFSVICGIIPTPLTNSYFFKMVKTTNQSCLMYITPAFMLKHPDEPPTKWLWKKFTWHRS